MDSSKEAAVNHVLTMANEDYLETIYVIALEQGGDEEVRSVDIAEHLNVSKASVSKALNNLKEEGYVAQSRYGKVTLTDEGRDYASNLWRCHKMIRSFLVEELHIDPEIANEEACLMEHNISKGTMLAWAEYIEARHQNNDEQN